MEIIFVVVAVALVLLALLPFLLRGRTRRPPLDDRGAPPLVPPARPHGTVVLEPPPEVAPPPVAPPVDEDVAAPAEAPAVAEGVVAPEEVAAPVEPVTPVAPVRPSFRDRLGKARSLVSGYFGSILSRGVDDTTWDELEEALIRADVGVNATGEVLGELRQQATSERITDPDVLLGALKSHLIEQLEADRDLHLDEGRTNVWLFVGVNGVGKTTTIGKVGRQLAADGRTVVMAAGDTFRAAAAEQLETWAERAGAHLVRGSEGADPSSVIFDAIQSAAARSADVVLADTAGRLHTKVNLMDELAKVRRVAARDPGHVSEVLLVVDATTGQNGLQQARQFTVGSPGTELEFAL